MEARPVPGSSLLARYLRDAHYADAFSTDTARAVAFADYVTAFYTTPVFRLERLILKYAVAKPSTDADARALADGADTFAAWRVEARGTDELLLCDYMGRTRSWLRTEALDGGGTRLWFGSAVVPVADANTGRPRLGVPFNALLGFHRLYSRVLLGAAAARLDRAPPASA